MYAVRAPRAQLKLMPHIKKDVHGEHVTRSMIAVPVPILVVVL